MKERSLDCAGRLLRRSEAEKQKRRPATLGMTGVAGGVKGAKVAAPCDSSLTRRLLDARVFRDSHIASLVVAKKQKAPICYARDEWCCWWRRALLVAAEKRKGRPAAVGMARTGHGGRE
jgi:hypothetical protein